MFAVTNYIHCFIFVLLYHRRSFPSPTSGPPGGGGGEPEEDAHVAFERNGAGYGPGQGMRARDRRKALLAAAVLPYLLAKLDAGHER